MAFPADVKLVRVTCGTGYDFSGEPISITLEVTPVLGGSLKRLIHAATGTFMTRDALTFKSDPGSPATFTVPSPAQAETWKDGSGEFFTNWSYSVTVTTRTASGKIQSWVQSFQPVDGQETVDLDLVPDGQIGSPTSAPAPAVTSVNGQSGAVVIDVGEAVTPESVAANLTVDAVDAKLPERLSESALSAAIVDTGTGVFAPIGDSSNMVRYRRHDVDVVTAFQAGHGWTNNGSVASADPNSTEDAVFGSQSYKIVTLGANQTVAVSSPAIPAVPLDTITRIWMKYDGPDKLHRARLWMSDDPTFARYYQIEVFFSASAVPETSYSWQSGEWVPIAFPWEQATVVGTPARGNLTYMRLLLNDRSAGETTVRLGRVEHFDPGTVFPNGVICLSYDDSFVSHYTVARAHLAKYGFTADLFPILERIDQPGYLTSAQVDELAKTHGWGIGAHATTYANHVKGMNGMSSAERRTELAAIRTWSAERGYGSPAYAYPNGAFTAASTADVDRYFSVGRTAYRTSREVQHANIPSRIQSVNSGFQTLAALQASVDETLANKSMLCIMFHDIPPVKLTDNDFAIADHAALIDYIASKGVAVKSLNEVVRAYA